jgi:hypothetical protein
VKCPGCIVEHHPKVYECRMIRERSRNIPISFRHQVS